VLLVSKGNHSGVFRLPITQQHTEERLSIAHVQAIAGVAGYLAEFDPPLDYGVDGHFYPVRRRGNRFIAEGIPLDFQLKATVNWSSSNDCIVYDLAADAYNNIISRSAAETTLILILLCLPSDQNQWLSASHQVTEIRNCCYWYLPEGQLTENTTSQRIYIPTNQILTPGSLEDLMLEERDRRYSQI
jgi:hypothetical protein